MTRRGGRLVTLARRPTQDKAAALGVHATFFVVTPDAAELAHLAGLVDDGQAATRPQPDVPAARRQEGVRKRGRPTPAGQDGADRPLTGTLVLRDSISGKT